MSFKQEVREKLDAIVNKQSEHNTELAVYNQSLKEHMRRTDVAEEAISLLDSRVMPIEQHVVFINRSVKILIGLVTVAASVFSIMHHFFK